jgi:hypothetical protein
VLFQWFGQTLWPFLELVGVYFASVLVLLGVGVAGFDGIRARRLGSFLAAGFWFAVARGALALLARWTGLSGWIDGLDPFVLAPLAAAGNTLAVIVLDGAIEGFFVRSWATAFALGVLLSGTELVSRALFVAE